MPAAQGPPGTGNSISGQEALLFGIKIPMKERDLQTRIDVNYPFEKFDEDSGKLIERFLEPPTYDVKFIYSKGKRNQPMFKIFAQRMDQLNEQYEIEITGQKKIKSVMK